MIRILSLYLLASVVYASVGFEELESRNKLDVAEAGGNEYEMQAMLTFWGSPRFMMQCLPPGSPLHAPFTIFFEVLPSGKMGVIAFTTKTNVTECISVNVKERHFPKPNKPFVVRIDLTFTE